MQKPSHHILVCCSFRANGTPQGVCHKKGSGQLLQKLEECLADNGLNDVMISAAGCLKVCDRGPAMVVYPEGWWYGNVTEDAVEEIIAQLAVGKPAETYLLA